MRFSKKETRKREREREMGLGLNHLLEDQGSAGPEPRQKGASRGRGWSRTSVLGGPRHGEDLMELLPWSLGYPQLAGAGCQPESAAEPLAGIVRARQAIWL